MRTESGVGTVTGAGRDGGDRHAHCEPVDRSAPARVRLMMLRVFCKRLEVLAPSLRARPGAQRRAASAPRPLTSGRPEAGLLALLEELTPLWPWACVLPEA